jgi:inner membrane protein
MFFFGHIGITLGAAVAIKGLIDASRKTPVSAGRTFSIANRTESLGKFLDLRLLVIGSLLPDIVDKPLGVLFFGEGRVFTHSLLVTLLVLMIGFYLYLNHKQTAVLAVAWGMASHVVLDFMWMSPKVFLWPLYGWGFPTGVRTTYLSVWLSTLTHDPGVYITEIIGLLILAVLTGILVGKKELLIVLKKGRIPVKESLISAG